MEREVSTKDQAYLRPVDDGLVMRPAGVWAREKLDYLRRYIDVFETAMRDKWCIRYYVDLFAGPGKNVDRDSGTVFLGSPLVALTTRCPFTDYVLVDASEENVDALRERCAASPHSHKVQIRSGDCNELVAQVVAQIEPDDWRSLNLAFLDPEGMEMRWDSVVSLAGLERMDLIINYPQGGLNRCMPLAAETEEETSVDVFFGSREWRKIYLDSHSQGKPSGLHRRLIDLYKSRLQDLGYQQVLAANQIGDEPLIRNVRRSAPLYRLLFASKHPLGHDFWHKVTRRDIYGQQRLDLPQ